MAAAVAGLVSILLAAGGGSVPEAWRPSAMARAHSHNDYEQQHPLADALALGFSSVEADVWWSGREVVVSHDSGRNRGRLVDLYLDPLQKRVDRLGSVYGDGRRFYLWIDLKEGRAELLAALRTLLARYPMLSTFDEAGRAEGPVTVILTGDEEAKARLVEGDAPRAVRDSNSFRPDDPPADGRWTWYALPWSDAVGWYAALTWDGAGPVPAAVSSRLRALVRAVHRGGRRLRLYEVPERTAAWGAAFAAGVDLISTDRLTEMRAFLAPTPVVAAAAGVQQ